MNTLTAADSKPHAFLGGSNYHWLGWDEAKLKERFKNHLAAQKGTALHEFAHHAIRFQMESEVTLYYSEFCYGTADAISFDGTSLRIHDLKTGATKTNMLQLYIYAALFCLERLQNPHLITFILRIYQYNDILQDCPDPERIAQIMEKIERYSHLLSQIR